ncbi:MAG: hypothetical protein ACI37Z_08475 [Candidatus Gastranaerophilaceae bacterium]
MVSSLRHAVYKNFGKIDYLHYFRRMIRDYEQHKWDFDVKNIKIDIPCPRYVCKRGFSKRLCLTIIDDTLFLKEFDRYFNGYIRPMQELRKHRILARRIFVKKQGCFTKYNQDCSQALYNCNKCKSKYECDLSKKLSKEDDHIYKLTRLYEILYHNLNHGYWADLVND